LKLIQLPPPQHESRLGKQSRYALRRLVTGLILVAVGCGAYALANRNSDEFAAAEEAARLAQPVEGASGLTIEGFQYRTNDDPDGHNVVRVRTSPGAIGSDGLACVIDIPIITSDNCAGKAAMSGAHIDTDVLYVVNRSDESNSGSGSNGIWYGVPASQLSSEEREALGVGNNDSDMFWASGAYSYPTYPTLD
jgi:hypothetical protein